MDVTLKPGSVSETVAVSGAATQLESETSSTGTVISETQVHDLPLNGRAYGDLMSLAPGVRRNNLENQSVTSRDASYNVNGQRSEFNNFLLDGLDNNAYGTSNQGFSNQAIPPSPDAINQFRIETNNYSAEFGRASGAVVNVSINSGTNEIHGKLWEYHRNTIFNAIGPFAAPINKLTGKSQKPCSFATSLVATLADRFCMIVFSSSPTTKAIARCRRTYAAATRSDRPAASGHLPNHHGRSGSPSQSRSLARFMQTVLCRSRTGLRWRRWSSPRLPAPNVPASQTTTRHSLAPRLTDDKGDGRLDYILSTKTTVFGRYSDHKGDIVDATSIPGDAGDGGNGTIHAYNRQIAAGITHAFRPNSTLDARIGFTWTHGGKAPYLAGKTEHQRATRAFRAFPPTRRLFAA